jgi:hypothetical protein
MQGGTYGWGTVFELKRTKAGWKELVLYSLMGGVDGANPASNLMFDKAGNLYGTTQGGGSNTKCNSCGTVFELTPSNGGWSHIVLYSFAGGADGAYPSGLTSDKVGNLYGTTAGTNQGDCQFQFGTAFKLKLSNGRWIESVLHTFSGSDGALPSSGLVFDKAGKLYGTAAWGGDGGGVVFQLQHTKAGWNETTLYSFTNRTDGMNPGGNLFVDNAGNLYGATTVGGCCGTLFKLTRSGGQWVYSLIYQFDLSHGQYPVGGLVQDAKGNFYGATVSGGANQQGTVFQLQEHHNSWNEFVLYSFQGGSKGSYPASGVIFGSDGNLYGTTSSQFTNYAGTVFQVHP